MRVGGWGRGEFNGMGLQPTNIPLKTHLDFSANFFSFWNMHEVFSEQLVFCILFARYLGKVNRQLSQVGDAKGGESEVCRICPFAKVVTFQFWTWNKVRCQQKWNNYNVKLTTVEKDKR